MITQTLKRWLHKMFAWWPWKRSPASKQGQVMPNVNAGITQDAGWHTTLIDGPEPLPGVMSVAVEQEKKDLPSGTTWPTAEERPERLVQPPPPTMAENTDTTRLSSTEPSSATPASTGNTSNSPSPTFEQQLEFLQYLVKRGVINEGFGEGQVPKQYRRKYE